MKPPWCVHAYSTACSVALARMLSSACPTRRVAPLQVYHSNIPSDGEQHACGFALLPLNTKTRGPAKKTDGASLSAPPVGFTALTRPGAGEDVVDEALTYFRANVLYRKFDVQGAPPHAARLACRVSDAGRVLLWAGTSDRTLIYLTLYISACLRKLESASNPAAAQKVRHQCRLTRSCRPLTHLAPAQALYTLAVEPFAIPGDAQWPLGGLFSPPATKEEAGALAWLHGRDVPAADPSIHPSIHPQTCCAHT